MKQNFLLMLCIGYWDTLCKTWLQSDPDSSSWGSFCRGHSHHRSRNQPNIYLVMTGIFSITVHINCFTWQYCRESTLTCMSFILYIHWPIKVMCPLDTSFKGIDNMKCKSFGEVLDRITCICTYFHLLDTLSLFLIFWYSYVSVYTYIYAIHKYIRSVHKLRNIMMSFEIHQT